MRFIILLVLLVLPGAARAQARVTVTGWTADGAAVVEVADPLLLYRAQDWARTSSGRFTARCTPAPLDAATETCKVCLEPGECDVVASSRPKKPPAVKSARTCEGPRAAPTSCSLAIAIGDRGTLAHALWGPRYQATVKPHWRSDGRAVVLVIGNATELGDVLDTFAVIELRAAP